MQNKLNVKNELPLRSKIIILHLSAVSANERKYTQANEHPNTHTHRYKSVISKCYDANE